MDLLINGLEKSPSRLSKCYIMLYFSWCRKLFSFLIQDYTACVLGTLSKAKEHPGIIFMGIIIQILLDSWSKYPNLKMHIQGKGGIINIAGCSFSIAFFFSGVVTVVVWLENFKYNRKQLRPEKCPACQLHKFARLIYIPHGRHMCYDRTAVLDVFGSSGISFISSS